ncbi:MAG: acyltransferase [Ruminococcus sp.]|nr:acyltransferase [Ruminococcus sp.]
MNSKAITVSKTGGYRYSSFDSFKVIAALMVVFLHFPFNGTIGGIIGALSRIGVPFFFMVSGFFSYKEGCTTEIQREKSKKKVFRYLF